MPRLCALVLTAVVMVAGACTGEPDATPATTAVPPSTEPPPPTTVPATTTTGRRTDAAGCPALADLRGNTPFEDVVLQGARPDGTVVWTIPLGGAFVRDMELADGVVYAGLKAGPLVAVDAATCREVWRAAPPVASIGLARAGGRLFGADTAAVAAYDTADGAEVWRRFPPLGVDTLPAPHLLVVAGDALLVPVVGRRVGVVAYEAADGAERFVAQIGSGSGRITGLAAGDEAFYVATETAVEARSLSDGESRWSAELGFPPDAAPLVADGIVFLAGQGQAAALDAGSGAELWRQDLGGSPFTSPPVLDHDELHLLDQAGLLHHVRATDGSVVFVGTFPACCSVLEAHAGLVLVQRGGVVEAFDLRERSQWSLRTGANSRERFTRVAVGGGLVVATTWSARDAQ